MPASSSRSPIRGALLLGLAALLALFAPASLGLAQSEMENRLRDALRRATAEARTLQDERASLLARQTQLESENKALQAQVKDLNEKVKAGGGKEAKAAQERAYQAALDEFNARFEEARQQVVLLQENLEKWKAAFNEAAEIARSKEEARQTLAGELAASRQQAAVCAEKNGRLFTLGNELLDRYENMSVADVLAVREPFTGVARVQLQTIVQDYQDQLLDNRMETPQ